MPTSSRVCTPECTPKPAIRRGAAQPCKPPVAGALLPEALSPNSDEVPTRGAQPLPRKPLQEPSPLSAPSPAGSCPLDRSWATVRALACPARFPHL